jgi:hypothetical protein
MLHREIYDLRRAEKLEEALQLSTHAITIQPNNLQYLGAAAWVHYDYLKISLQNDTYDVFKETLIKIRELNLPMTESLFFDKCAWQIGKMVFSLMKMEKIDYGKINELFDIIKNFHFTKPSDAYSFIYKAFHKGHQNWTNYLIFADWWNFDNLHTKDYLKEEYNGKQIISLAEKAYIAYSKKLLDGEFADNQGQHRVINKEKIQVFLPKLEELIKRHPEYQYPPYYKAKLLLALGNEENALSAFLPFAIQKRNEFWVWELLAEICSTDKDKQFACYCKGLSLKTPEEFLVKLRQNFAQVLIERSMYDEAKTEIQTVISTRENNNWRLPNQISQWIKQEWYQSITAKENNKDLYLSHLQVAEEILFHNIPKELIVIEFVNSSKKVLSFVKNKEKHGFFKYSKYLTNPEVGETLQVRFDGEGKDNYFKILTAKKANPNLKSDTIRNFDGFLIIKPSNTFGFIDDIHVGAKLIQEHSLNNGDLVKGRAILSFNKERNEWGWKAVEICKQTCD